MTNPENKLFSGKRYMFWAIVPIGGLMVLSMNIYVNDTTSAKIVTGLIDVIFVAFAFSLWNPKEFVWAIRFVGFSTFLAYSCSIIYFLFLIPKQDQASLRESGATLFNAIRGFVFIGIPGLLMAFPRLLKQDTNDAEFDLKDENTEFDGNSKSN